MTRRPAPVTSMNGSCSALGALTVVLLSACACSTTFRPALELRWFRTAAEREASYSQAYVLATEIVTSASTRAGGLWGVVLDADETVLDNSEYRVRLARAGKGFESSSWEAWAREKRAKAFPGARAFVEHVRRIGGKVAIVTNRDESLCEVTRENLRSEGITVDAVLCAAKGMGDKQSRFDEVATGRPFGLAGPVRVVLFVGDSIRDCPGQSQQRYDLSLFGVRCVVMANPMYGSWTENAFR